MDPSAYGDGIVSGKNGTKGRIDGQSQERSQGQADNGQGSPDFDFPWECEGFGESMNRFPRKHKPPHDKEAPSQHEGQKPEGVGPFLP